MVLIPRSAVREARGSVRLNVRPNDGCGSLGGGPMDTKTSARASAPEGSGRSWRMTLLAALALLPTQLACEDVTPRQPAAIAIVSPGSGAVLATGADVDIRWQIRVEIATVHIDISRDGGLTWGSLAADVDAAAGVYQWTVAGPVSGNCRLRISDAEDETRSAVTGYSFEIATAFLTVVSPNGNERWGIDSTRNIRWSGLAVANVKIELSRDGNWADGDGSNVETIEASLDASTGSYEWIITGPASANCKVRISDADGGPLSDTSNGLFEIADPELTLLTPGGGSWQMQDTMDITWIAIGVDEIRIEIYRQKGVDIVDWTPLATVLTGSGSYTWTVNPGSLGVVQNCKIRLVNTANPLVPPPAESLIFTIQWDGVYRVKLSGDGSDGSTWATAYRHPQAAVVVAGSADIWVAAGTYADTEPDGVVLDLYPNTTIYGGFLGNEYVFPAQRTGVSKLDGQNSARGVTGADNAIFDGFTVVRGSTIGDGGGMRNSSSNMTVTNCVFGGLANAANTATGNGGAIYNSSSMTITNCSFSSNTGRMGGGIYSVGTTTIVDCIFDGNTATTTVEFNGGGGVAGTSGTVILTRCIFTSNQGYDGGGVCFSPASGTATNCLFWDNQANHWGGGVYLDWDADYRLMNCSIGGNRASGGGGGVYDWFASGTYTNIIVWGNSGSGFATSMGVATVNYSCIEASSLYYSGIGNVTGNPKFRNLGGGNLRLSSGSPCINSGTSLGAPSDDLDGNSRPRGGGYDMGAYEF